MEGFALIENRIYVETEILLNEYAYRYGMLKDRKVKFTYYNVKFDRETDIISFTYSQALKMARERARDGRYKNFEYYIETREQ